MHFRISRLSFEQLAKEIVEIFPNGKEETYYITILYKKWYSTINKTKIMGQILQQKTFLERTRTA